MRVPWTERRSKQSILKEISPEYSLEKLMLKLNLRYFRPLVGRADSWENILMEAKSQHIGKDSDAARLTARGEGDNRGRDGWMASLTP